MSVTAVSLAGFPPVSNSKDAQGLAVGGGKPTTADPGSPAAKQRRDKAFKIRHDAAVLERDQPLAPHPDNGDETLFEDKIASYSKGLPHNELGEVDPSAYQQLLTALASTDPAEFEAIPVIGGLKLADPQGSYAFELEGADSHRLGMLVPPAFSSAWAAGEIIELYWQALARDVPFIDYRSNKLIAEAAGELSALSDFRGPKTAGKVTADTLFRGETPADLVGPYISQFLWREVPFGATTIVQRYRSALAGSDHMTDYGVWLKIQNGSSPTAANKFDETPRYIRNGRDLGEFVQRDFTYQAFLHACLILLSFGPAAADPANPYRSSVTQEGFLTFGGPHILDLVARVSNAALRASWCQKWLVHRRLRPEAFAARVHNRIAGMAGYPIHPEVFVSQAAARVFGKFGTYLLPMAHPGGAPAHPSFPAGHAAIAGACVTVLKYFFNESFLLPNPVQASDDGLMLLPFSGVRFTIGGELNKLAANVGLGRNMAGVHWRSDMTEGLKLGETVALNILGGVKATCNKNFAGFALTKFDGTTVTV